MEAGDWISVGAVLVSIVAAGIAIWQARIANEQAEIAKQSAVESKRSADAAEQQTAILKEQWEAEKSEREAAGIPAPKLYVQDLIPGADYLLLLTNRGESILHVDDVTFDGHDVSYMEFNASDRIPKPTRALKPADTIAIFRGVRPYMNISRGPFCRETDWGTLVIRMVYGGRAWEHHAELRVLPSGEIEVKNENIVAIQ